jgi:hypothetical protein
VEKTKYKAVLNCAKLDPWNTVGFMDRSIIQKTKPVKKTKHAVASQSSFVSGFKNIHWISGFESLSAGSREEQG